MGEGSLDLLVHEPASRDVVPMDRDPAERHRPDVHPEAWCARRLAIPPVRSSTSNRSQGGVRRSNAPGALVPGERLLGGDGKRAGALDHVERRCHRRSFLPRLPAHAPTHAGRPAGRRARAPLLRVRPAARLAPARRPASSSGWRTETPSPVGTGEGSASSGSTRRSWGRASRGARRMPRSAGSLPRGTTVRLERDVAPARPLRSRAGLRLDRLAHGERGDWCARAGRCSTPCRPT